MVALPMLIVSLTCTAQSGIPGSEPAPAIRMIDLDGDGLRDRLEIGEQGDLGVALNRGGRRFEPIAQSLPRVVVSDVLVTDLDGDGRTDLYLVSPGANRALLGDGAGGFVDGTSALGLEDEGVGVTAERVDLDADGLADLLLHDAHGDVVFWGAFGGGFTRDPATPSLPAVVSATSLAAEPTAIDEGPAATDDGPEPAATPGPRRAADGRAAVSIEPRATREAPAQPPSAPLVIDPLMAFPTCAKTIEDRTTGSCIAADSTPTLGRLHPLSVDLFVTPSDGFVGMGTTTPTHRLQVAGDVRANGDVIAGSGSASDPSFRFGSGTEATGLSSPASHTLSLVTAGAERLRVTSAGRVGIGTSTPASPLDVLGNVGVQGDANLTGSLFATRARVVDATSSSAVYGQTTGSGTSVTGYTQSTGGRAANFQIANASNNQNALTAQTSGTGSAGLFSILNTASSDHALEAGTVGHGSALAAFSYSDGPAILGSSAATGNAARFEAVSTSNGSPAVYVNSVSTGNGLEVHTSRPNLYGISSIATGSLTYGVYGESPNIGIVARTTSALSVALLSQGNFVASGSKSFAQPHPTDPAREIDFTCLEGNESGTYFRGTSVLHGGRTLIRVPEAFRLVTEPDGLSVQLTAVGERAALWVETQDLERLVVRGDTDVTFHYLVNGVRRGYADFAAIRPNRVWVPEYAHEPYGTQYPEAIRRLLVENGTLNADLTPNVETAARLGWPLKVRAQPVPLGDGRPSTPPDGSAPVEVDAPEPCAPAPVPPAVEDRARRTSAGE